MLFSELVAYYERIEATTKRLEMTDLLVELFNKTPPELADKVAYLTLGRLYPSFIGIELGMADKLALRAIKQATGSSESSVQQLYGKLGDIGLVAQEMMAKKSQEAFFVEPLTVKEVYESLEKIAKATGEGSVDVKVQTLSGLIASASPKEAKYILRIVTGKMRLGVADMTILDALAILYGGSKETRAALERAYNLSSDIGLVAKTVATGGLDAISGFKIKVGKPIRPMLAERLSAAQEILEKLDGSGLAEFKYDGERMQIHKLGEKIWIFSRRQEDITSHYPDVIEMAKKNIMANEAIVEAEAVAIDPNTGDMLPFQELMHRRRKYGIEKAVEEYPLNLFFFDVLYVDGRDLTSSVLTERRNMLEKIIKVDEKVRLSDSILVNDVESLDRFLQRAVESGCEGLIVKSVSQESVYRAGARGWLWIKYKRDYRSEMMDTVDLVVIGAFHGRGKRSGKYGALLMAAYDKSKDVFQTVCKVGSGFTDEDLERIPKDLEPYRIPKKHPRVESGIEADVWFTPKLVLEIMGAEITLSPTHTCAMNLVKEGTGLAIRFPRFTGRYRLDKTPEDATSPDEIVSMYRAQLKKVTMEVAEEKA